MGVPAVLPKARTDAEAADLVTSDVNDNDKPFCGERAVEATAEERLETVDRPLFWPAWPT